MKSIDLSEIYEVCYTDFNTTVSMQDSMHTDILLYYTTADRCPHSLASTGTFHQLYKSNYIIAIMFLSLLFVLRMTVQLMIYLP